MFGGLIAVIVEGTIRVGGFNVIWNRAESGDRIEIFDFDPSPFKRHTFW
jgi:sodium-coupled monocarboxylate transporter 8/12